jgi:hypothetical protein
MTIDRVIERHEARYSIGCFVLDREIRERLILSNWRPMPADRSARVGACGVVVLGRLTILA